MLRINTIREVDFGLNSMITKKCILKKDCELCTKKE